jgi:hypothetical protein
MCFGWAGTVQRSGGRCDGLTDIVSSARGGPVPVKCAMKTGSRPVSHRADAIPKQADAVSGSHERGHLMRPDFSLWDGAVGVGPGHRQGWPGGASDRRSVPGAAWLPIDQAVRVSTCEAQFHNLSGSLVADIGDEIAPSRGIRQHGDLVIRQSVQLSI